VRAAIVDLVLQMRGEEQGHQVLEALRSRGLQAHMDEGGFDEGGFDEGGFDEGGFDE